MKKSLKVAFSAVGPIAMIVLLTIPIGPLAGGLGVLQPIGGIYDVGIGVNDITSQTLVLSDLGSPVDVILDEWGIPHIYAETISDAFLVLGYLHARDRLFQMTMQKYLAAGRISEIVGGRAISSDKYYRAIGLARSAELTYQAFLEMAENDPDVAYVMENIDAYVTGINTFLDSMSSRETPLELKILGFIPEAWEPVDIFAWSKMMSWGLSGGFRRDIMRYTLREALDNETMLENLYPDVMPYAVPIVPEQYNLSITEYPDGPAGWPAPAASEPDSRAAEPDVMQLATTELEALLAYDSQVINPFPDVSVIGSNSWAVDGSKSATGYPILANDPHLQLQLPSLWYEVHLVVPGEMNVQGGSLAGTPAVLIGHTEHISWGMTNVGADVLDLFVEEVNPANSSQYRYNGEWVDFQVVNELIYTAEGNMIEFPVTWSVHGPCIDSLIEGYGPAEDSIVNLSMNWTGTGVTHEILAVSMLNLANDLDGYYDALYWWDSPPHNFIYADDFGNIAITVAGRFPIRSGYSGKYPVQGLNDSIGMTSSIPYAYLPRSVNPSRGYLQSANQLSIDPAIYAYSLLGPQSDSYRGRRIDHLLATDSDITVEDMMVYQADVLDVSAESMVGFVVDGWEDSEENNASIQDMVDILSSWNFAMSIDNAAPTIWRYLLETLKHAMFDEVSSVGLSPTSVRTPVLEQILRTDDASYIDNHDTVETESIDDIVVMALHQCYNEIVEDMGTDIANWTYGEYHILRVEHLAGFTYLGGTPHPGSGYTLNAAGGWVVDGGPSRRMIVRHGPNPAYYTVYPGGQSGNMFSQHWSDLFVLWNGYDEATDHYGYTEEHFYASFTEFVEAGTGIERNITFVP